MVLAQATAFRGDTAFTVAAAAPRTWRDAGTAPERLVLAKLRTAIHGFELALVASGAEGRCFSAGANFTHVVGERLEWHGEWLVHDRPSRRDFVFVRAARAASDGRWNPELMTILGMDDGSVTIVPTSGWTLRAHVDVYVRGVLLAGARRSEARDAPVGATVMLGLAVRY